MKGGGITMTLGYASDGCLVSKSDGTDTWAYEWDYERRLVGFKENGASLVQYGYNPTGTRRYSSDSTLGLTNCFYHGSWILADFDSGWTLKTSYLPGSRPREIICMRDETSKSDPAPIWWFVRNLWGATRELLDDSEAVATRYDYDVWGAPSETMLVGSASTRYLGSSKEYGWSVGWYGPGTRWFSPTTARMSHPSPKRAESTLWGARSQYKAPPMSGQDFPDSLPFPIPCVGGRGPYPKGYCDTILEECRLRHEMDIACQGNWLKAIGYRCCQCFFKRCWTTCLFEGSEGGQYHFPGAPEGEIPIGPPLRCKNDTSVQKCHQACWASNWYPVTYVTNEPCDDEPGGNLVWDRVCQSTDFNMDEYGETQALVAQSEMPVAPRPVMPWPANFWGPCRHCYYRGIECWRAGRAPLLCDISVNAWEQCPSRAPMKGTGYFSHWSMINSCHGWEWYSIRPVPEGPLPL